MILDPRAADQITHSLADVIRFRLLMISAGYEDGNDANALRRDPCSRWRSIFRPSIGSCARSRQYRGWSNLPDVRAVLRMGRAMVDLYCSPSRFPNGSRWTSTTRSMRSTVVSSWWLFNAHYDENGIQPKDVFDGEGRFFTAVHRPPKRQSGKETGSFPRLAARDPRSLA